MLGVDKTHRLARPVACADEGASLWVKLLKTGEVARQRWQDLDHEPAERPIEAARIARFDPTIGLELLVGLDPTGLGEESCRPRAGAAIEFRTDLDIASSAISHAGPALSAAIDEFPAGTLSGAFTLDATRAVETIRYDVEVASGSGEVAHGAEWRIAILDD